MSCPWSEAIEQLESANRALLKAGNQEAVRLLARRARVVERIAALAKTPATVSEELRARLGRAIEEGEELRRRLMLGREQARVALDELNRAAVLMRRLEDGAAKPASRFDCRG